MCLVFCVRNYLGRESQEKRQTTMDFDGWQFFAPKVNLRHRRLHIDAHLCFSFASLHSVDGVGDNSEDVSSA